MGHSLKAIAVFALLAGAASAQANGIFDFSGDLMLIESPGSVQPGMLESNDYAYVFVEREDYLLGNQFFGGEDIVPVDISEPGNYDSLSALTPDDILLKGPINSYFFHQDPVGIRGSNRLFTDYRITFEGEILGLMVLGERDNGPGGTTLNDTDVLGAGGTTYPTNGQGIFRGTLDSTSQLDQIQWSFDKDRGLSTLTIGWLANSFGIDQMRVITTSPQPQPAPGAAAMLGMALAMGGRRRRNQ